MISESSIRQYIGQLRWAEYSNPFIDADTELIASGYRFDTELRGFLMSAISVIEIALVTQINLAGDKTTFNSFGQARRRLETLPAKDRQLIAINLGSTNYKQLRGALQNLNYLRNRIAHHERVWNHRNRFAFPGIANQTVLSALGSVNNRHVLAFSLIGIAIILSKCPTLIDFERRLLDLTSGRMLSQAFLLESMGFEER